MEKKILIVIGSPRENSNTSLMAEAFFKGAERKGYDCEFFNINERICDGCKACNKCWSSGTACVSDDSFNEFVEKLKESDIFVVASPVYWGTFPAPLKAYIDKMYAFCVPWCIEDISGKLPVLLTAADGADDSAFIQIKATFNALAEYMKWRTPEVIAVPGLVDAGAVIQTEGLKAAEKLGESIE